MRVLLSCLWSIPLQHRPCPCCTFLTQLILARGLICIPSSCRHRLHCSSRPPFLSTSLRLQMRSCLTGPCVISAPTLLTPRLPSQKDGLHSHVPRLSPGSTGSLIPALQPSLAAGQHLPLHHDTLQTPAQPRQPGEWLQGAGGSPGSRVPDTPSLLWPVHTLADGTRTPALLFGARQFRGCPHDR